MHHLDGLQSLVGLFPLTVLSYKPSMYRSDLLQTIYLYCSMQSTEEKNKNHQPYLLHE